MKKLILISLVALVVMSSTCFGAVGAVRVTANTVSFNSVGVIVTFNTVVNKILIINDSTTDPVHISYTGLGWNADKTAYTMPLAQGASSSTANPLATYVVRILPATSLSMDINTDKIGYVGKSVENSTDDSIQYVATSDDIQL